MTVNKWFATALIIIGAVVVSTGNIDAGNDAVVAEVGPRQIMASDIDKVIEKSGAKYDDAADELEARRAILDSLIGFNLEVISAYAEGYDTASDFVKLVAREEQQALLDIMYQREITDAVNPDEAALREYYDLSGEELDAAHILLKDEKTADEAMAAVQGGMDFGEAAEKYSTDGTTKFKGGDLGWFSYGTMVAAFNDTVFGMKVGEVKGPVRTQFGWHIIKLLDRRSKDQPPFEKIKETLRVKIIERRKPERLEEFAMQLMSQFPIEINTNACDAIVDQINQRNLFKDDQWRRHFDVTFLTDYEKGMDIATYPTGKMKTSDYIEKLRSFPAESRPDFRQPDSVKVAVFKMLFPEVLRMRSESDKWRNDPAFKARIKAYEEASLAERYRDRGIPQKFGNAEESRKMFLTWVKKRSGEVGVKVYDEALAATVDSGKYTN